MQHGSGVNVKQNQDAKVSADTLAGQASTTVLGAGRTLKSALVELDTPHNVATWLLLRRVLSGLGMRFIIRIHHALAKKLILLLCALTVAMIEFISPQTVRLTSNSVLLIIGATITAFLGLFLVTMFYGARDNKQFLRQMAMLNDERAKMRQFRAFARRVGAGLTLDTVDDTIGMLESAKSAVELDAALFPVRVLGLRASIGVVRTVCVTVLTFVSFMLRFFIL